MLINHSLGGKTSRQSLFICSPSYSGEFNAHFVESLLQTCELLASENIPYKIQFSLYDSLVARSRNELAKDFLDSDFTHVLMVDSDEGWDATAVIEMLKLDKEFITGAVPSRKPGAEEYALKIYTNKDRTPSVNEEGLIYCGMNGVAFAIIKRIVFEKIAENDPYLLTDVYPYFQHAYTKNGDHYGEDNFFVKNWINLGRSLWIYPNITFKHGNVTGNYHEFLLRQPKPMEDCMNRINEEKTNN